MQKWGKGWKLLSLPAGGAESFKCVHIHGSVAKHCRWLADALVCVDVALTVRTGVCHILEVIN